MTWAESLHTGLEQRLPRCSHLLMTVLSPTQRASFFIYCYVGCYKGRPQIPQTSTARASETSDVEAPIAFALVTKLAVLGAVH